MKKMFLTSLFATMVAMPAFADNNNSYTNNHTYENSCTVDVLGESSGTAPATAQWSTNSYTCAAGTYLPDGDTWTTDNQGCTACPANSYCGGDTYTYSEANDQGITACSSVGNGTFTLSDGSSSSADSCYRNCAAADVAHLKSGGTVSGRFYSNNTNQCEPANAQQCATGYHYVAGTPDLNTIIGVTTTPTGYATTFSHAGEEGNYENMRAATAGILGDPKAFVIDFGDKGRVRGHGLCSTRGGTKYSVTMFDSLTDESDQEGAYHCYCRLESYTPVDEPSQNLSSSWVYIQNSDTDEGYCSQYCGQYCGDEYWLDMDTRITFLSALFGAIQLDLASCQANTITINWGDGDDDSTNNPTTQCTYDGDLVTPTTAPTKRGHTFTGWTFSTQQ